jgi:hypothetical protein
MRAADNERSQYSLMSIRKMAAESEKERVCTGPE